jgi:SSS family solute:Na+ symporter
MTQLGVIVCYFVLLLSIGYLANRVFRGTAVDFMLASHAIGPFLLLLSLFGTTMTAFALVGSTGRSYTLGVGVYGLLASASGIVHSLCFFVIAVPLWSIGRRHGYATQIQFFRERLDSDLIGLLLFPFLVGLVSSYALLGVVGSGAVVNSVTTGAFAEQGWFAGSGHGVPAPLASAVICGVVFCYVFFGGMRGTVWANAFQVILFMSFGLITFVLIANALGGGDSFFENVKRAFEATSEIQRSRAKIPKPVYFSFLFIPLSVAMFPHVFQNWLTARSAASFKLSIVMYPILIMVLWLPCVSLGVWASVPTSGVPAGTPENQVLATLVSQHAGPVLAGLLTAGVLAAAMAFDSQLIAVGTMFTEDVVVHYAGPGRLTDRQVVIVTRVFVALIMLATYVMSLFPRAIFDLGLWSFSGFTGLFPLVYAAIYWRRLTAPGAIACVLATLGTWSLLFWQSGFGADTRYAFPREPLTVSGHVIVPPMLPVVTILFVSTVTLVVVSLATKPPEEATLAKFFRRSSCEGVIGP